MNKMSLNVNYSSLYKNGIDTSVLKEVSKEILNRAAQKSAHYTNGLSSTQQIISVAKPVELGLDLYNGKLDTTIQKQVAINNTLQFQLNAETLQSIKFLNSQAAISSKIDGKFMPNITHVSTETQKVSETNKSQFMSIKTAEASKDKDGSNPFYFGELLMNNSKKENEKEVSDIDKSIFI